MLAILGAAAISYLGQSGGEANRYRELLKLSGTKNGYRELVQAAIILRKPQHRPLVEYLRAVLADPSVKPPAEIPPGLSGMAAKRFAAGQLSGALDLVRLGLKKPISYPDRNFWMGTIQPEFASFKSIARLYVSSADVSGTDGKRAKASSLLLEGLHFSTAIEGGTLIATLVGTSTRSILLNYVAKHLDLLSIADWKAVGRWSAEQDRRPTSMLQALVAERQALRRSWFEFCRNPDPDLETLVDHDQVSEISKALRRLSEQRKAELYDQFLARLESSWRAAEKRLRQPEAHWTDKLEIPTYAPAKVKTVSDPPGVARGVLAYLRLYQMLAPNADEDSGVVNLLHGAQLERIRNRIVGLYAQVELFRFRMGRLPNSLAEAVGHVPRDPATGKPYSYILSKNRQSFRIFISEKDGEQDLTFHRKSGPKP